MAVRSSAVGEDGADASFAGHAGDVPLVVRAEDVSRRGCATAGPRPTGRRAYRERLGVGGAADERRGPARWSTPTVSGVLFTCNPVSGDPSTVAINASWGLGLAVVGGEVTPDEYLLSKVTGEVVKRTIGDKHLEYRPDARTAGRAEERRAVACLDEAQLAALLDVARRIERHFGAHQDVEWAFAGRRAVRAAVAAGDRAAARPRSRCADAMSLVMGTFGAGAARWAD